MNESQLSMSSSVSVPPHVLVRELQGEAVILDLEQETYFGLDAVGTRMWNVIQDAPSLGAAWEVLLAEFEVDGEVLQRDLLVLVAALVEQRLVDIDG